MYNFSLVFTFLRASTSFLSSLFSACNLSRASFIALISELLANGAFTRSFNATDLLAPKLMLNPAPTEIVS